MNILGINAFHPDSSACILIDGEIIVAIEEERLKRIKHWAGFPELSIKECLGIAGLNIKEIDKIAINRNSNVHKSDKLIYTLRNRPKLSSVVDRIKNRKMLSDIPQLISDNFNIDYKEVKDKVVLVEHHLAHLASTYLSSNYNESVILSVDGFGDFVSTMWGLGTEDKILIDDYVAFPHSLGMLYQAITQYLGFWNYGDEYKVMGMAAYGDKKYVEQFRKVVMPISGGKFELNTSYFKHPDEGISMEFSNEYPLIGKVYKNSLIDLIGPERKKDEVVKQRHKDIACSLQKIYEEIFFHNLNYLNEIYPKNTNLCLSGGCAQNSVANGKITTKTNFEEVWVQPAAGDAGGALGAALYVSNIKNKENRHYLSSAALGKKYSNKEIEVELEKIDKKIFKLDFFSNENILCSNIVESLANGSVIGFFHGAFEWGPRALGNRSIIVDPRISDMKGLLNKKIKKRESFRPFAPSVLREEVGNWFEKNESVPFMTHVLPIKKGKKHLIPAVTHYDGTGRLHTVTESYNARYYKIIKLFFEKTGIPMILNTSFNENEPIVNTPKEALNCFLRTNMDVLVLENYFLTRI